MGYSCRILLSDNPCGTLLRETLAARSCMSLLRDILVRLTLLGRSCRTLLWDTLARHSCGTLLRGTLAEHSCGTLTLAGSMRVRSALFTYSRNISTEFIHQIYFLPCGDEPNLDSANIDDVGVFGGMNSSLKQWATWPIPHVKKKQVCIYNMYTMTQIYNYN